MTDALPSELPDLDDAACQRALAILVDTGTSIAKELKSPSADVTVADRSAAFDRVALAVRRTIILWRHIADTRVQTASRDTKRSLARREIIRAVGNSIETKADPAEAPGLRVELLERIDSLEFAEELEHRSPGELIVELCRDLGLANVPGIRHYPRRTPADIAILCAQAAAPAGSGHPQWLAAAIPHATANDAASPTSSPLSSRQRAGVRAPPS